MRRSRRILVLVAGALVLSACSLLAGKHEDLTIYAPTLVSQDAGSQLRARKWQLVVGQPLATSPLDGARIVVMPKAGEIEFYKGARWRDNAPSMIQELLVQALRRSENLTVTAAPSSGFRADAVLQSNLQSFQAEYRGARIPIVVTRINVQVVDISTGRAFASRSFAAEQPSADASLVSVFAAFEQELRKLLPQIAAWAVEAGDANLHDKP